MPVERVYCYSECPEVSVVIPSWDNSRAGNLPRLIQQLKEQDLKSVEIILSTAESPNGHARNLGAEIAKGEFLVFIDDDALLGHERVLTHLLAPFKTAQSIGLTGVSQFIPPDANWFQQMCARQIPRAISPLVDELTDSDMVTTLCLAIRRDLFNQIGKMNEWLLAGVDPELRYRVRKAGYRVVVVPQAWAYHPVPENIHTLVRYAAKKGGYTAWQYRFARNLMYDCPDGHVEEFTPQITVSYRTLRKGIRLLREAVQGHLLGVIYDLSYAIGYLHGMMRRWP